MRRELLVCTCTCTSWDDLKRVYADEVKDTMNSRLYHSLKRKLETVS